MHVCVCTCVYVCVCACVCACVCTCVFVRARVHALRSPSFSTPLFLEFHAPNSAKCTHALAVQVLRLLAALSPARPPIPSSVFRLSFVWPALLVQCLLLPCCLVYTLLRPTVIWSGEQPLLITQRPHPVSSLYEGYPVSSLYEGYPVSSLYESCPVSSLYERVVCLILVREGCPSRPCTRGLSCLIFVQGLSFSSLYESCPSHPCETPLSNLTFLSLQFC